MLLSTLRIVQTHIVRRKQQNTLFHWPLNWGSLALAVYFLPQISVYCQQSLRWYNSGRAARSPVWGNHSQIMTRPSHSVSPHTMRSLTLLRNLISYPNIRLGISSAQRTHWKTTESAVTIHQSLKSLHNIWNSNMQHVQWWTVKGNTVTQNESTNLLLNKVDLKMIGEILASLPHSKCTVQISFERWDIL